MDYIEQFKFLAFNYPQHFSLCDNQRKIISNELVFKQLKTKHVTDLYINMELSNVTNIDNKYFKNHNFSIVFNDNNKNNRIFEFYSSWLAIIKKPITTSSSKVLYKLYYILHGNLYGKWDEFDITDYNIHNRKEDRKNNKYILLDFE